MKTLEEVINKYEDKLDFIYLLSSFYSDSQLKNFGFNIEDTVIPLEWNEANVKGLIRTVINFTEIHKAYPSVGTINFLHDILDSEGNFEDLIKLCE